MWAKKSSMSKLLTLFQQNSNQMRHAIAFLFFFSTSKAIIFVYRSFFSRSFVHLLIKIGRENYFWHHSYRLCFEQIVVENRVVCVIRENACCC
jgi:hypothetical protein